MCVFVCKNQSDPGPSDYESIIVSADIISEGHSHTLLTSANAPRLLTDLLQHKQQCWTGSNFKEKLICVCVCFEGWFT